MLLKMNFILLINSGLKVWEYLTVCNIADNCTLACDGDIKPFLLAENGIWSHMDCFKSTWDWIAL